MEQTRNTYCKLHYPSTDSTHMVLVDCAKHLPAVNTTSIASKSSLVFNHSFIHSFVHSFSSLSLSLCVCVCVCVCFAKHLTVFQWLMDVPLRMSPT